MYKIQDKFNQMCEERNNSLSKKINQIISEASACYNAILFIKNKRIAWHLMSLTSAESIERINFQSHKDELFCSHGLNLQHLYAKQYRKALNHFYYLDPSTGKHVWNEPQPGDALKFAKNYSDTKLAKTKVTLIKSNHDKTGLKRLTCWVQTDSGESVLCEMGDLRQIAPK